MMTESIFIEEVVLVVLGFAGEGPGGVEDDYGCPLIGPSGQLMRGFTVVLMILVGAVFVAGPAGLLAKLTPEYMDVTSLKPLKLLIFITAFQYYVRLIILIVHQYRIENV